MINKQFIHGLTVSQEKCLVKHARELFTKLVQVGPGLTAANIKGIEGQAETAIELAEVMQRKLMEAGYGIRAEEGTRLEIVPGDGDKPE